MTSNNTGERRCKCVGRHSHDLKKVKQRPTTLERGHRDTDPTPVRNTKNAQPTDERCTGSERNCAHRAQLAANASMTRSAARAAARRRSRSGSSRRTSMSSKSWMQSKRRDVRRRRRCEVGGGEVAAWGRVRSVTDFHWAASTNKSMKGRQAKIEPVASHEEGSNSGWEQGCAWVQIYRWAGGLLSPPYTTLARFWHT